ncbi:MAG: type II toxin-antitoxin system mRNA interferase toxin, RelE/StbE family [Deltaproteobacteria bacterium]|jgi:addiction module RelE/StbE family toxin|nr:type II toxin-antitoxin system mRNA interferase toxin, RelE/StbE family [Deltaproteobacteria bacterium]MBW2326841.1 type II toxin-antitoxin system mRNA interferase toxin, RelE/StbE family [Deltaproteobacteria bacterium]
MYTLSWSNGFRRGFKKATRKDKGLQEKIFSVLEKLSREPFDPALKTHKLHGKLIGLWACQVEYDCRIVFAFEKEPDNEKDLIVLVDIGKHDEVY